jgi:hypothetical protein
MTHRYKLLACALCVSRGRNQVQTYQSLRVQIPPRSGLFFILVRLFTFASPQDQHRKCTMWYVRCAVVDGSSHRDANSEILDEVKCSRAYVCCIRHTPSLYYLVPCSGNHSTIMITGLMLYTGGNIAWSLEMITLLLPWRVLSFVLSFTEFSFPGEAELYATLDVNMDGPEGATRELVRSTGGRKR